MLQLDKSKGDSGGVSAAFQTSLFLQQGSLDSLKAVNGYEVVKQQ